MFTALGVKAGTISQGQMWAILPQTWVGNLLGSVFVALLYSWGGGSLLPVDTSIVHTVALAKTTQPAMTLFFKGVLCNWLVCWRSGWQSARKVPRNLSRSGGACWHLLLPATSTPWQI